MLLLAELKAQRDEERGKEMSAYMRNLFSFLGIRTPKRREICKPFFKTAKEKKAIDWAFVDFYWEQPWRECQYVAKDYLALLKDHLMLEDINKLKRLVLNKSWWDTVDGLDRIIGHLGLKYSEIDDVMLEWSIADNIWLRRVAIDHQLLRKDKMNTELLEQILINNLEQQEFFINKAIGWILRDYSKTDPTWVQAFIEKNRARMASLSIREGGKYL